MKTISIVTPCYNEQDNVIEVYDRVRAVMASLGRYRYEHIFIDNASRDNTVAVLKQIAAVDRNLKIIVNTRNFGQIRSPHHALHQASGDAVIGLAADLQDPPEMIADMIGAWEKGTPVVLGVKADSDENGLMFWMRKKYYRLVNRLSDVETYENFTGFGLYDRKVMDRIKQFKDPYPYFRGLVAEIGLPHAKLYYHQPLRKKGKTKNNFYTLYDFAMLGITNFTRVPLRLITFTGFFCSIVCILIAFIYLAYKLMYWDRFSAGVAPVVLGFFFIASVQLFFMGILGEYIGAVHTIVQNRPYVFEGERINFEYGLGEPLACSPNTENLPALSGPGL
jgi:glycosyltransferase involved in cell wall biosynthesis